MKFIITSIFIFVGITTYGQTFKVKVKLDQKIVYKCIRDSSDLNKLEVQLAMTTFQSFYDAVEKDDYEKYLSLLSPQTIKKIRADKLKRKFGKFKAFSVSLNGKISIKHIKEYGYKSFEPSTVYSVITELPNGQEIDKRPGFDPIKTEKIQDANNLVGLFLTKVNDEYKVVILW